MMRWAWKILLLAGLTLAATSGCDSSKNDDPSTTILTVEDNGRAITLPNGSVLEVILKGNPTTGQAWQTVSINPAILAFQRVEYNPDSTAAGSGGTYVFTYNAIAAGATPLQLNNAPATNSASASQTFQVTVTVTP